MDNTSMSYKSTIGELIDVLKKYNSEDKIATIRLMISIPTQKTRQ